MLLSSSDFVYRSGLEMSHYRVLTFVKTGMSPQPLAKSRNAEIKKWYKLRHRVFLSAFSSCL